MNIDINVLSNMLRKDKVYHQYLGVQSKKIFTHRNYIIF